MVSREKYFFLQGLKNESKESITKKASILELSNFQFDSISYPYLDLDFYLNLDRARALARDLALNLAGARARALARDPSDIYQAIVNHNLQKAKQLAQTMQKDITNPVQQRLGTLLYELLVCVTATTFLEIRQAWRQYLVSLTEYALIGYDELEKQAWWKRWLPRRRNKNFREKKQATLNLQNGLKIVMAREQGKLPAWEGIRIVGEKKL